MVIRESRTCSCCVPAQGILTSTGSPQVLLQCTDQPSLGYRVSPLLLCLLYKVFLCAFISAMWGCTGSEVCHTCCIVVEGLYNMGVQEPGPLGITLLHSIAPVQQGSVTTGHGQNEGRRCIWPQAQGQMTADLTFHSYGGQRFEPGSLICCYFTLTFQISFLYLLCHFGSILSATAALTLKNVSEPHWSCLCNLPCSGCSHWKGGGCWRIQKHYEKAWTRGICSWGQTVAESLTPIPQEAGTTFSSSLFAAPVCQAKHLACSWELPSAIEPITSSAVLCTNFVGPDHKIIVLTWKIQRLAWLQSTTFNTVDETYILMYVCKQKQT